MHHRELCPKEFVDSPDYAQFWDNLRENKAFHEKVKRIRKDGAILWLDAMYTLIVNEAGNVAGIVKIAIDITNQEMVLQNSSDKFMTLVEEMTSNIDEVHRVTMQAVDDMTKLQAESDTVRKNVEQIGSMAAAVKDIAAQSNLLGLNASIEAARAGEHGKGFSVVAHEVRKMADTSKASAEDITQQLEQIGNSLAVMADMVKQTTSHINKNSDAAKELKTVYEHVAKTAEELASII